MDKFRVLRKAELWINISAFSAEVIAFFGWEAGMIPMPLAAGIGFFVTAVIIAANWDWWGYPAYMNRVRKRKLKSMYVELARLSDDYALINDMPPKELAKITRRFMEIQIMLMSLGFPPSLQDRAQYLEFMSVCAKIGDVKMAMTYPGN